MTSLENDDKQPDSVSSAIAAFIDGETVDIVALKQALATAAGRDYLVDLLSMRGMMRSTFSSEVTVVRRPTSFRHAIPIAAAIALAALGGYIAGQKFDRLAKGAQVEATPVMVEFHQPPPVPAPTRVIQLQPGVNWKDASGRD